MTTFPSIAPVYPASKGSAAELSGVQLGDGYKARYSFGLNNTKPEWRLEWLVDQNSAEAIDLFLQSCADSAEFFQWQPPDSSFELNWKCEEWSIEQQSYDLYSIKATFEQVFELSISALAPQAVSTCYQDELCSQNDLTISSTEAGQLVLFTLPGLECNQTTTLLELVFLKEDGTVKTELYNPSLQVVTKFKWVATGSDGRINSATSIFSSASANFPNNGSLINQYLNIYNGTLSVTYRVVAWISQTSLGISALPGGTPVAPQTVDRNYRIGGKEGVTTNYAIDGTTLFKDLEDNYQLQRFIGYDRVNDLVTLRPLCCSGTPEECSYGGGIGDFDDPNFLGPISSPWAPEDVWPTPSTLEFQYYRSHSVTVYWNDTGDFLWNDTMSGYGNYQIVQNCTGYRIFHYTDAAGTYPPQYATNFPYTWVQFQVNGVWLPQQVTDSAPTKYQNQPFRPLRSEGFVLAYPTILRLNGVSLL